MGFGSGNGIRAASVGFGLSAEVSAFELTHRSLSLSGTENPNLWRWSGYRGLKQGLLQSLITFGSLKTAGHLTRGENVFVRHLLQDSGMVLGHKVSGALGVTPLPEGSLTEQFLHAEATNLQIGAGMALGHRLAPKVHGFERGLDLFAASSANSTFPFLAKTQSALSPPPRPAFAEGDPSLSNAWKMTVKKEGSGKTEKWDDKTPVSKASAAIAESELAALGGWTRPLAPEAKETMEASLTSLPKERPPLLLKPEDKALLEKAWGQKIGDSLNYPQWKEMEEPLGRKISPDFNEKEHLRVTDRKLHDLYRKIMRHFYE